MMPDSDWWNSLEQQWQQAFGVTVFRHLDTPSLSELEDLYRQPALRFAGPRAPYPNMNFELTNLSGIAQLHRVETLVITHHSIKNLSALSLATQLKSLFLFNNEIESLEGIENLATLEQLYVQFNKIRGITPIKRLIALKEMYIHNNLLESLDGLTKDHSPRLTRFVCYPNQQLAQKEIIEVENQLGIKCRGLY